MRRSRTHPGILFTLIFLCIVWLSAAPCTGQSKQKTVLVLHSYHKAAWTDSLLAGIEAGLDGISDLDLVVEYMDTKRVKSDTYYKALDEVYRIKYGNTRFDTILTSDDNAYRFALGRQGGLFRQAPIVFCGVNRFDPQEIAGKPQVTGVVEKGDFEDTLRFAVRVRPKAAAVHVILDHTRTGQINLGDFREVVRRQYPQLAVRILIDISLVELADRLAALPAGDFAFFISFWQDGAGNPVSPDQLSTAFHKSRVPVFGRSEWMLNKGLTGGKCVSGFYQGQAAARLVKRILAGESAATIPVNLDSPNRFMFDYPLLIRYGIKPGELPPESILFNKPAPTFYEKYRRLIWSVVMAFVALCILVFFLAINIVLRHRTEKALRESEARYRQLVQHAPAGIYEFDIQRVRFLSVNDVMCEYTGYTKDEFMRLDPLALLSAESGHGLTRLLENITPQNPNPPPVEYCIRGKNGRSFWVLVNAGFTFGKDDRPVKATCVAHDLTALRQAEAEKKQLEAKLIQIQKIEALGTLAGGIAHDFNNLLMGIQGNASLMLLDRDRPRDDTQHLRNIESHVQRGVGLTSQLLGLARGGKYEIRATDINRLIRESAAMFSRTKKEIRIHQNLQAGLWTIECDRGQVDQVLLNIFVNAWQAMPGGGELTITTENTVLDDAFVQPHSVSAGHYVKICVTDTGTGMDPDTIARIFDPFFTTKEMGRGTGLGLASAYGIVKNHDGIIDASSRLGEGSTFNIYLPAVDKAVVIETVTDVHLLRGNERILLVDDETMILDIGRQMLEKLGYAVLTAASGAEAVEIFQENQADLDLVVLDMIMPDLSGEEAFTQLQEINPAIRVLLSSGYSIDGQATRILARGCRGFIQKPFNLQELSRKIRKTLDE